MKTRLLIIIGIAIMVIAVTILILAVTSDDIQKTELLEEKSLSNLYKDKPEVVAFYAKYDDANVSVREDHVSYFAGNGDDFRVRMNLYFAENSEDTLQDNVYRVSVYNKTFDVFYKVDNGSIDDINISSREISFNTGKSENSVFHFYLPSAWFRTSESCHYGLSWVFDRMGGTPINFKVEPTESILLDDSNYNDITIYYSGDPARIYLSFGSDINYNGPKYYPHCQKPLQWAKQDAILWDNGSRSDSHFGSLIQLMIEHDLVSVSSHIYEKDSSKTYTLADKITYLPPWLKETAKWWNQQKISDDEFLNNLEHLINNDVIKFSK